MPAFRYALWGLAGALIAMLGACRDGTPVDPDQRPSALRIDISGLPTGAEADVRITGPGGFSRTLTGSDLVAPLAPGRYSLRFTEVRSGGFTYATQPAQLDTTLLPGDTLRYGAQFSVATGALAVHIDGLPGGVPASVRITGSGLSRVANGSVVFGDLPPGPYAIAIDSVSAGGTAFKGSGAAQVQIAASTTPTTLTVHYENLLGVLLLTATGFPADAAARSDALPTARLQGPRQVDSLGAFDRPLSLPVGNYTITPQPVALGTRLFAPVTRSFTRTVHGGARDSLPVAYQEVTTPINIAIDNVVVTQAVQRGDNSIPLIFGRDALLRAFVRADRRTGLRPLARARIFDGTTPIATLLLTPPDSGIPTVPLDAVLASTYHTRIPADLIRAQLRVSVEVDPDSSIGEVQRNDNVWPTGSVPRAVPVTTVPVFSVRFVPISLDGVTGNIASDTQDRYLSMARSLWPIAQVNAEVRTAFVSSVQSLQPNDANGGWNAVLNELRALRTLDGAPATMHYYGVVHPSYTAGMFGLALVGTPIAVGWDLGDAGSVAAHEWGHNFGRLHAPCGDPPNGDANYPHIGAAIGLVGWNDASGSLQPAHTADIMSYCSPAWVSDYTYSRALAFRQGSSAALAGAPATRSATGNVATGIGATGIGATGKGAVGRSTTAGVGSARSRAGLLVWGRVVQGTLIVEPAFQVDAVTTVPALHPTHIVELFNARGQLLAQHPIAMEPVDHAGASDGQFAAVLPWATEFDTALTSIRVRDVRSPIVAATGVRHASAIMGLLQDTRTGRIRGFIRGTNVTPPDSAHTRVIWSDGLRSPRVRTGPQSPSR